MARPAFAQAALGHFDTASVALCETIQRDAGDYEHIARPLHMEPPASDRQHRGNSPSERRHHRHEDEDSRVPMGWAGAGRSGKPTGAFYAQCAATCHRLSDFPFAIAGTFPIAAVQAMPDVGLASVPGPLLKLQWMAAESGRTELNLRHGGTLIRSLDAPAMGNVA